MQYGAVNVIAEATEVKNTINKIPKMNSKKYFFFGLSIFCASVCIAQEKKPAATSQQKNIERPKLVVGIVVDQMRYDYLYRYWEKYSDGGFKRLLGEGFSFTDANYNYSPTFTGPGHACIYTGTTPSYNGIISNDWYDRKNSRVVYCAEDSDVKSVGSSSGAGKMSPKNLLTTTVTDELRLATNFKSKVIGISVKDRGAILPAGHLANAAYWHDPSVNSFISSTYYMEQLPKWAVDFNNRKLADSLLSQSWNTLLPIEQYTESTADDSPYEGKYKGEEKPTFPHDLAKISLRDKELIRRTPFGNTFIKEFAEASIEGENLGGGETTDFLAVSFSCTDYVGHMFGINAIETEDTYLRLDKDIAEFLSFLDNKIGKKNVLLFFTSDHGAANNPQYSLDKNISGGFFNADLMTDSLNKLLSKNFGKANFISFTASNCLYLNHSVIDSMKLNLDVVENACVAFISNYKAMAIAVSGNELEKSNRRSGVMQFIQNGFYKQRAGDVFYELEPGYMDWSSKTGTTHGSPYSYDTHVPLVFYGWKIPQGKSSTSVAITDIAPTISSMLHIENPSGCSGTPLLFIEK
jgi:predicted AlkP superfamily pyrophosphatase or phosphodiesterase